MAERKKVKKINPKMKSNKAIKEPKVKNIKMVKPTEKRETKPKNTVQNKQKPFVSERISMLPERVTPKAKRIKNDRTLNNNAFNESAKHSRTEKSRSNLQVIGKKERSYSPNFKVLLGNKFKIRKKRMVFAVIALVVVVSIAVFCMTSPTGPSERITNAFALLGSGEYPASLPGTGVVAIKNEDGKTFALTNSHLCGFNTSGKRFIQLQHNFSNPVLETSAERTLMFNRESTGYMIANNSELLHEGNIGQSIYCADISDSGSVAFATASPSYSAQVSVFSKDMEQYFSWYLADGLISDITLSSDGDYLAVSVLAANTEGMFVSKIYCFETDSKEPIYTKTFEDDPIIQLDNVSDMYFLCRSKNKLAFLGWEEGELIPTGTDLPAPAFYNCGSYGVLGVFGQTASSKIINFDSEGNMVFGIEFKGLVDDVSVYDDLLYLLSGNQIYIFDSQGNQIKSLTLEQSPGFIAGTQGGVLCVHNLQITFYEYTPVT